MNYLHLSYTDDGEGAAIASRRICEALTDAGADLKLVVKRKHSNKVYIQKHAKNFIPNVLSWLSLGLDILLSKAINKDSATFFSVPLFSSFKYLPEYKKSSLIHLHWINRGFLNLFDLLALAKTGKPIFITMHDNWYFTGGCHMVGSCDGYLSGCKNCPKSKIKYFTRFCAEVKRIIFSKYKNIKFIAISEHMGRLASSSYILRGSETLPIPNCVDTNVFKPYEKLSCRKILGISESQKVILFFISNDTRKGTDLVRQIMTSSTFSSNDFLFLGFGCDNTPLEFVHAKNFRLAGRFRDQLSMSVLYNAADVLLSPATEEPFGLTHIEAMACGLPTIGFNNTGSASIIGHRTTGYLAELNNLEDIVNGINFVFGNTSDLSKNSRIRAEGFYSYKAVSKLMIDSYQKELKFAQYD